jgi:hypothetical protein
MERPMPKFDDLSRSLVALDPAADKTLQIGNREGLSLMGNQMRRA